MKTLSTVLVLLFTTIIYAQDGTYVCPPCDADCHDDTYTKAGTCPMCNMTLINTSDLSEGLSYTNIYPNDVCEIVSQNPEVVLLDVRRPGEYDQSTSQLGILQGAINIPVQELAERIDELEKFKDREIIVYCSVSMRSPRASKLLGENGYVNVKNMLGGLNHWNQLSESELKCKNDVRVNF